MGNMKEFIHRGTAIARVDDIESLLRKPIIKLAHVYDDDDFIIDILKDKDGLPVVRVSIFEDGHYLDETFVYKKDFLD